MVIPPFLELAEHLPADGLVVNEFLLLVCMCIHLLLYMENCLYLKSSHTSTFLILTLLPLEESEREAVCRS